MQKESAGCGSVMVGFGVLVLVLALIAAGGPVALALAVALAVTGGPVVGVVVLAGVALLALLAALDPN